MIGHANRDCARGLPQVPLDVWACLKNNGDPTWPEVIHDGLRAAGNVGHELVNVLDVSYQHRRWHVAAAALGGQESGHGSRLEGIAGDAIDSVGRHHDALP
jgi:hypothetical protein